MFTLVLEIEAESLAAFEAGRVQMFANPNFQQAQTTIDRLIEFGRQEFYTLEAAG